MYLPQVSQVPGHEDDELENDDEQTDEPSTDGKPPADVPTK